MTWRGAFISIVLLGILTSAFYFLKGREGQEIYDSQKNQAAVLGAFASQGLLAHYTFESVAEPTAGGYLASNSYALSVASASSTAGKFGNAFEFGRETSVSATRFIQDDFTICLWFKTTGKGSGLDHYRTRSLVTAEWPGAGRDFAFGIDSNGVLAFGAENDTWGGTTVVNDNTWRHGCATREKASGEARIYANGVFEKSGLGSKNSLDSNSKLTIGDQEDTPRNKYSGLLDELRIYNRVLSASEIAEIYNFENDPANFSATQTNQTANQSSGNTGQSNTNNQANNQASTQTNTDSNANSQTSTANQNSQNNQNANENANNQNAQNNDQNKTKVEVTLPSQALAENSVLLKNFTTTPTTQTFTISRIFVEGEIKNFPQAKVSGTPTATQADVMTRYADGSVKHALVSFVASVPSGASVKVDFVNQNSCRCGTASALSKEEMLSSKYNFNAELEFSKDGASQKVNAREMIQNGDFRYWLKGELVTQVILEDRTTALKYDLGFKNKATFLASPNGYFNPGDTTLEVFDASDITVPGTLLLKNEKIRICEKNGNVLKIGSSSCPNKDGRGFENTPIGGTSAWGVVGSVVGSQGFRLADSRDYKSLHPIFVVTFTPETSGSTKVEAIVENAWTQKLQDQTYDVTFKAGANLASVFSKTNFKHTAMTRWRKIGFSGQALPPIVVDLNLRYLAQSKAIPNFNPDIKLSNSAIQRALSVGYEHSNGRTPGWQNSDKGEPGLSSLTGFHGQIQRDQFAPGGRPDIGLFPLWQVNYLYMMSTSDTRTLDLREAFLGNAEAGSHFPFFLREVKSGKPYVKGRSEDMFGRTLSLDARPLTYSGLGKSADEGGDSKFMLDTIDTRGWNYDTPHEVSLFYLPYIATGDWYYLEGLYGMASYALSSGNVGYRGRDLGIISGEDRNVAWVLRTLAHSAYSAPDNSPEKKYFTDKLNNNVSAREGTFDIKNGSFYKPCTTAPYDINREQSAWCIGKNTFGKFPNPLYFFSPGGPVEAEGDPNKASMVFTPFMYGYLNLSFAHIEELGFNAINPYRTKLAQNYLGQMLDPDFSPFYLQNYRTPSVDKEGKYFTSWAAVKNAMRPEYQTRTKEFIGDHDYEHGYPIIAYAVSSFLTDLDYQGRSGLEAWSFFKNNIRNQKNFEDNPKWAFLPRSLDGSQRISQNVASLPTKSVPLTESVAQSNTQNNSQSGNQNSNASSNAGANAGGGGGGGGGGSNQVTVSSGGGSSGGGSSSGGGGGGGGSGSSSRNTTTTANTGTTARTTTTTTAQTNVGQSSSGSAVSLPRTLSRGSEGSDVTALQNFLITQGHLPPGNATGYFGPLTESAVKAFQKSQGIVSSGSPQTTGYGMAGNLTRSKIVALSGSSTSNVQTTNTNSNTQTTTNTTAQTTGKISLTRNLSRGSEGSDVTALQNFLITQGHLPPGNATGYFGPLTESAVKAFQKSQGIVSSGSPQTTGFGNVGPGTRARIEILTR